VQRKESGKGRGRSESGRLWLNTTKSIDKRMVGGGVRGGLCISRRG
jgi:hypothetical protein